MNSVSLIKKDVFNSEHFGIQMYDATIDSQSLENSDVTLSEIIKQARNLGARHITARVDTSQKSIANELLNLGFRISDTLVTYSFSYSKSNLPEMNHKVELADCTDSDLPYLRSIARESFKIDRFHSDESLDNDLCDSYYDKWIENSYKGFADKVIVARYQGEPVGFTTGKLGRNASPDQLVLSAVSDKYRGLGIYTSMIHEGVVWAQLNHKQSSSELHVGTQIDNIAVQRAWAKLGFAVVSSQYVLRNYYI